MNVADRCVYALKENEILRLNDRLHYRHGNEYWTMQTMDGNEMFFFF